MLLIEPDWATRQLYAREVGRYWPVLEAATVQEAVGLRTTPAAVVLEPYQASDGDAQLQAAWTFVQQARTQQRDTHFVVCSVLDERRAAYACGVALYLLKPISPQQLVIELQRLLGNRSQSNG